MADEPEYDITIACIVGQVGIDEARLIGVIEAALRRQRVSRAVISVALVDDAEMVHLNKRHLDHEGSTDVLTFNMGGDVCGGVTCDIGAARSNLSACDPPRSEHGQAALDHATRQASLDHATRGASLDHATRGASPGHAPRSVIEGEIVISVDTASREAERRQHSLEAELALYAVHGTLHLSGHDDQNEEEAARMHIAEDEVLASAGWGRVYGTKPA